MEKQKILFISSYLRKSRGTVSIAEKLSQQFLTDEKYKFVLVSRQRNIILRVFDILFTVLFSNFKIAFIDTYSGNSFFIARVVGYFLRFRGKHYSLIIRGGNFVNFYNQNSDWIQADLLKANSLLSPSHFIIDFFNSKGIQVGYLPNNIDETKFPYNPNRVRKTHSLLWVRAFTEIYNPAIPIQVLSLLAKKYPDVKLTMVGPDLGLLKKTQELIKELKLEELVTIVGPVTNDQLFDYYQSNSVYLNTTTFESFGMALLEAACCGIPIISTNVGEIPYIYEDGKSILLVNNFSIEGFVAHIESVFESSQVAEKLSIKGHEVSKKYSFEEIRPLWDNQFNKFNGQYAINSKKLGVLFIGTFLSRKKGTKGPTEIVSRNLSNIGYKTQLSSSNENKLLRIFDIVKSIIFSANKIIHIDVFSGPSFLIAKYSVFISSFLNKTVVLNLHGGMLPEYYSRNKEIFLNVFRKVKKIYTPSKYLQAFFLTKGFEINYIPNSIDLSKFPFSKTQNVKKILWVRAFTQIYQPQMAVEILERVRKEFPEATLTMIGPDLGLLPKIKEFIKEKKLEDFVVILGPIDNNVLVNYFHQHTVFINTTKYESFGVAVLESASSGLPIVSTNVGEIPFLWKDKVDILIDSTNSSEGMAACVLHLLKNEGERQRLIENAKNRAKDFSWDKIEQEWIKNIEELT